MKDSEIYFRAARLQFNTGAGFNNFSCLNVARFAAEVEAGEEAVRTFFTVYRIDGEGLSHAVADSTDRDEARQIAHCLLRVWTLL